MALKGVALTIQYTAWDTAEDEGKTGDSTNHTLRVIKDGTASIPTNSPAEVDATNTPGVYKLNLTAAEMDALSVSVAGKSSTADVVIIPFHTITENGRLDVNTSSRSSHTANNVRDAILSDSTPFAGANVDVAISSRGTADPGDQMDLINTPNATARTAIAAAIWDRGTTVLTTVGSIGKLLVDNINAAITSRSSHSATNVRDTILSDSTAFAGANIDAAISTRGTANAGDQMDLVNAPNATALTAIAAAAWNRLTSALTTVGSIGKLLVDNVNAAITSRAETGEAATAVATLNDPTANEVRDAILSDAIRFSGANIDAAISSRSNHNAGDVLTEVVEGTYTLEQMMRIVCAALVGEVSGGGTHTITFKGVDGVTNRIVATVTTAGNRTSVTLDAS